MSGRYRKPHHEAVPHKPTKFDGFTIVHTGKPYNSQGDSGRSRVLKLIDADVTTIGHLVKKAAEHGFASDFVVSAFEKHHNSANAAYRFSEHNDQGKTVAEVKRERAERLQSPEMVAKRQQREAEKAARLAAKIEKEQAKLREKEEKARARADKAAQREAEREAKKAERAAAKTAEANAAVDQGVAAEEQPAAADEQPAPRGRRVRRGAVAA